jgi:hypothetical protein
VRCRQRRGDFHDFILRMPLPNHDLNIASGTFELLIDYVLDFVIARLRDIKDALRRVFNEAFHHQQPLPILG